MLAILRDFLKDANLKDLRLLDLGSSGGIIAHYFSNYFGKVLAIDIDRPAVESAHRSFKNDNMHCLVGDALYLPIRDEAVDVLVCNHIYEHVADARRLITQVYRVLKPGGICYFAAGNRITLREPHYQLPLLSILPKSLSHIYLRFSGKGNYYFETLLTYRELQRLVQGFLVIDYTKRIIESPNPFYADYMIREGSLKAKIAKLVVTYAYWLCPTYIWLLQKPNLRS